MTSGQNMDSLKLVLKNAKHDTTRVKTLLKIIDSDSVYELPDTAIVLCHKVIKITDKNLLSSKGDIRKLYLNAKTEALDGIGLSYHLKGNIPLALEYFNTSLKIAEENKNNRAIARLLLHIGCMYYYSNLDISKAQVYYYKSLKISEEINDKALIVANLTDLGEIYFHQGEMNEALNLYLKGLEVVKNEPNSSSYGFILSSLGYVYLEQSNLIKASDCFEKFLANSKQNGSKLNEARALNSIGLIYFNKGEIEKSFEYLNQSLHIYESIGSESGIVSQLANIGEKYFKIKDYDKSEKYLKRSLYLLNKKRLDNYLLLFKKTGDLLSQIYYFKGNYKEAYSMHVLFKQMSDSINIIKRLESLLINYLAAELTRY